jgi:hypothetical protein
MCHGYGDSSHSFHEGTASLGDETYWHSPEEAQLCSSTSLASRLLDVTKSVRLAVNSSFARGGEVYRSVSNVPVCKFLQQYFAF